MLSIKISDRAIGEHRTVFAVEHKPQDKQEEVLTIESVETIPVGLIPNFNDEDVVSEIQELKKKIRDEFMKALNFHNDTFRDLVLHSDVVLSGSSIYNLYNDVIVNDFDLYSLANPLFIKNQIDWMYPAWAEIDIENDKKYNTFDSSGKLVTDNAITFKDSRIQFVYRKCFDNERQNFDFEHCCPYYNLSQDKLYITPLQFCVIKYKLLVPHNPPDGRIRKNRYEKFIGRGMTPMFMIEKYNPKSQYYIDYRGVASA